MLQQPADHRVGIGSNHITACEPAVLQGFAQAGIIGNPLVLALPEAPHAGHGDAMLLGARGICLKEQQQIMQLLDGCRASQGPLQRAAHRLIGTIRA